METKTEFCLSLIKVLPSVNGCQKKVSNSSLKKLCLIFEADSENIQADGEHYQVSTEKYQVGKLTIAQGNCEENIWGRIHVSSLIQKDNTFSQHLMVPF